MRKHKPASLEVRPRPVRVLSVSPFHQDHEDLEQLLCGWTIERAFDASCAKELLRDQPFAFLICERDVPPGSWKDVLAEALTVSQPPFFFVTSRLADDHLWAEALNLGTYDVLAKPFDRVEVIRAFNLARLRWKYQDAFAKPRPPKLASV